MIQAKERRNESWTLDIFLLTASLPGTSWNGESIYSLQPCYLLVLLLVPYVRNWFNDVECGGERIDSDRNPIDTKMTVAVLVKFNASRLFQKLLWRRFNSFKLQGQNSVCRVIVSKIITN